MESVKGCTYFLAPMILKGWSVSLLSFDLIVCSYPFLFTISPSSYCKQPISTTRRRACCVRSPFDCRCSIALLFFYPFTTTNPYDSWLNGYPFFISHGAVASVFSTAQDGSTFSHAIRKYKSLLLSRVVRWSMVVLSLRFISLALQASSFKASSSVPFRSIFLTSPVPVPSFLFFVLFLSFQCHHFRLIESICRSWAYDERRSVNRVVR